MKLTLPSVIACAYLDYFNNYLTVEAFAEHYGFTIDQALSIIDIGREIHEKNVKKAVAV